MTHPASSTGSRRLLNVALSASILTISGASYAEDRLQLPAQARAMTGVELYDLYRDKSWPWPGGAGRMETNARRFTAVVDTGGAASWAEGRWIVTDGGRLCFAADWHTPSGIYPDRTCFIHRLHDDTIYQRREPSGDWYVFKHAEPAAGDEFSKLVREDLVSVELEALRPDKRSQ